MVSQTNKEDANDRRECGLFASQKTRLGVVNLATKNHCLLKNGFTKLLTKMAFGNKSSGTNI
jgi:hypothetical protein